uniref:Plexin-A1-like n=1 Tax=Saccoglossus kowalevskii TaxID=10224 RepID=A0ABM0MLW1_SACKO|nr:PREDICTED: plexin-A1-like [Saccoglossus kowalevskii]
MVAGEPCQITKAMFGQVHCTTSATAEMSYGPLVITIDNAVRTSDENYNYTTDPQIYDINPKKGFLSGGVMLVVKGHNLHIVTESILEATVMTSSGPDTLREVCEAAKDGLSMSCKTPNIGVTGLTASKDEPVEAVIAFHLDGVVAPLADGSPSWGTFSYYPDPVYFKFPEPSYIRQLTDDKIPLYIDGIHLNLSSTVSDVTVVVGNDNCNVTHLLYDTCICIPPLRQNDTKLNEPRRKVEVFVGNLEFFIGYLQYVDKVEKSSSWKLIVSVMMGLLLIIVLGILYWRYRLMKRQKQKDLYVKEDIENDFRVIYRAHSGSPYRSSRVARNTYLSDNGACGSAEEHASLLSQIDKDLALNISDVLIERRNLELCELIGRVLSHSLVTMLNLNKDF